MNGSDNRNNYNSDNRLRTDRSQGQTGTNVSDKPRFKIKDGNIIRINPDGTTTSRPLTDDERRRLEAARMNAAQNRNRSADYEAARRRADQQYLVRNQAEAAEQIGVAQKRRQPDYQRQQESRMEMQRRRRKIKINPGAVIFVVLMALVVAVSANQIKLNGEIEANAHKTDLVYSNSDKTGESTETDEVIDNISSENQEESLTLFDSVSIANTLVHEGNLILVNYEFGYVEPASLNLKNAYEDRTGVAETGRLKVSKTTINMEAEAFAALEKMVVDLKTETGCGDLMIVSGHRTIDDQQQIYNDYLATNGEEYVKEYVANPGYSEHHTGLACDLTFYNSDGYSIPISEHEFGYWLGENCMNSGFIRRYPEEKADITKISYEAWHFRYVGIPHAYAITTMNFCLEEYIDYIKDFTADTKLLHVKSDKTLEEISVASVAESGVVDGWLVYYVPASDGDNTDIPVLRGNKYENYIISGNNTDGFIVTVSLG